MALPLLWPLEERSNPSQQKPFPLSRPSSPVFTVPMSSNWLSLLPSRPHPTAALTQSTISLVVSDPMVSSILIPLSSLLRRRKGIYYNPGILYVADFGV